MKKTKTIIFFFSLLAVYGWSATNTYAQDEASRKWSVGMTKANVNFNIGIVDAKINIPIVGPTIRYTINKHFTVSALLNGISIAKESRMAISSLLGARVTKSYKNFGIFAEVSSGFVYGYMPYAQEVSEETAVIINIDGSEGGTEIVKKVNTLQKNKLTWSYSLQGGINYKIKRISLDLGVSPNFWSKTLSPFNSDPKRIALNGAICWSF